jgi:hypothetical protein
MTRLLPHRALRPIALLAGVASLATAGGASAIGGAGPTLGATPTVAGLPTQGSRLVATPGSWTGSGTVAFAFQWYRCDTMGARCEALRGVTERGRRIGPGDVGHTLSLEVRATDETGTRTVYASLVGPVAGVPTALALKARPLVSGDSVLGSTIRVDPGRWQPEPTGFNFQWARCNLEARACTPIAGATGETHQIGEADLGHPLAAIVQARSRAAARAVFSVATPVAVAERGTTGPSSTGAPLVATVVQQGKKLSGATGIWSGSGTLRYAFQWYRCDAAGAHCTAVRGATASTYTPAAKDVGRTLGLSVRATDAIGTGSAYASLVGPVAGADATLVSAGQPTIAGSPTQGSALEVSTGSWTQAPSAFAYQWQRCNPNGRACAPIAGATASAYVPVGDDVGHALVALVRATAGSASQDAFSVATRPIAAAPGPVTLARPGVSGTIQEGQKLTASPGAWSGSGEIAHAYQWYRCDSAGAHCKTIRGATAATYTQGARDVGQTLGLAVRAADATGTTTVHVGLVGLVAGAGAKLVATGQPVVAGTPKPGEALQVANGSWNRTPTSSSYQWQRCNPNGRVCAPIPEATASSYTLTAADAGQTVLALVQVLAGGLPQAVLSTTVRVS